MKKIHKDDFDGSLINKDGSFNINTNRIDIIKNNSEDWGADLYIKKNQKEFEIDPSCFEFHQKCPICKSTNLKKLFIVRGLKIFKCNSCDLGFQNPMPNDKGLNLIYSKEYIMSSSYSSEVGKKSDYIKFKYGAQELLKKK